MLAATVLAGFYNVCHITVCTTQSHPAGGSKKQGGGGQKNKVGGSKKQGGGQKNKVGGQKNRLSVKQLGNPLSFPRFVVTYLEVDCNQFLQSSA